MIKLSREQLKNVKGGNVIDDCEKPLCTACTDDSQCTNGRICRYSVSCIEPKVCAKPYYC